MVEVVAATVVVGAVEIGAVRAGVVVVLEVMTSDSRGDGERLAGAVPDCARSLPLIRPPAPTALFLPPGPPGGSPDVEDLSGLLVLRMLMVLVLLLLLALLLAPKLLLSPLAVLAMLVTPLPSVIPIMSLTTPFAG